MAETTITEQIVREAPQIEAAKFALMEQARNLVGTPVNVPAYQVAGLTPDQIRSQELARSGIGSFAPFIQSGGQSIEAGQQLGQTATGILTGADTRGQFSAAQQAAQAGIAAASGAGTRFDPTATQAFMNPYQAAVTQNTLAEMRRQADIARQGQAAQAIRSGAFGGTREGVQRAETERGVQDIMSQRIMQDYAQNYAQAQQAAQQAFEAQQQRQISQAGLLGQLGQGIGSLAGQQFGIGQNIASGLGALGSQAGQLGVQQAALGEALQRGQLQDIQTLSTLGQQQQAQQQAEFEAQRMTQLQSQYEPYQRLGFLSDIYKGAPTTQSVLASQTAPSASPLAQVVGAAGAALTGGAAAKKIGLL